MRYRLVIMLCVVCLSLGVAVIVWGIRSFFRSDTIEFAARSTGSEYDGISHEWNLLSNRGSLRFNINWQRWHYLANPNPFPANSGPEWLTGGLTTNDAVPNSGWRIPKLPGNTITAHGFDAFGFGAGRSVSRSTTGQEWFERSHTAMRLPHWFIAAVLIGLSGWMLYRTRRRRRRLAAGLCPGCGYDLRASKDRCPECGREIVNPLLKD